MDYVINSDGVLVPADRLYHWGIKGQKWGVRRYQNKDGSLTPAGKKRYAQEEAALKERERVIKNREREAARKAKLDAKKADLDARENALNGGEPPVQKKSKRFGKNKAEEPRQKTIKDLSDDELRDLTSRMTLEKNYLDAQKNLAAATPKQISAGKQFMDAYGDEIIKQVVVEPGKKYVEKLLAKKLGLDTKDPLEILERKAKESKYKKEIAENEEKERKAKSPAKKERTADDLIEYLSKLEGDDLAKLDTAADRAAKYQKILDLLKKDKDNDKK